eukprot:354545-Chlamydomonas_euryale.AAC.8
MSATSAWCANEAVLRDWRRGLQGCYGQNQNHMEQSTCHMTIQKHTAASGRVCMAVNITRVRQVSLNT